MTVSNLGANQLDFDSGYGEDSLKYSDVRTLSTDHILTALSDSIDSNPSVEKTLGVVDRAMELIAKANDFSKQLKIKRSVEALTLDSTSLESKKESSLDFLDLAVLDAKRIEEEKRSSNYLVEDFLETADLDSLPDDAGMHDIDHFVSVFQEAGVSVPKFTWEMLKAFLNGEDVAMEDTGEVLWEDTRRDRYVVGTTVLGKPFVAKYRPSEETVDYSNLLKVHEDVKHPNILEIAAVGDNYLLFPRVKGDLFQTLQDPTLTEKSLKKILHGCSLGLSHMHSKDYAHLDVKDYNFLVDENGNGLVCDLDATQKVDQFAVEKLDPTLDFLAPELVSPYQRTSEGLPDPQDLKKSDVYAFGMMLFFALAKEKIQSPYVTKEDPFGIQGSKDLHVRTSYETPLTQEFVALLLDEEKIAHRDKSGSLRTLMSRCLDKDPANRPTMEEIAAILSTEVL